MESTTIWALGASCDFEAPNGPTTTLWVYSAGGLVNGLLLIPLAACFYYSEEMTLMDFNRYKD